MISIQRGIEGECMEARTPDQWNRIFERIANIKANFSKALPRTYALSQGIDVLRQKGKLRVLDSFPTLLLKELHGDDLITVMKMLTYLPVLNLRLKTCTFYKKVKKFAEALGKIKSLATLRFESIAMKISDRETAKLRKAIRKLDGLQQFSMSFNSVHMLSLFTVSRLQSIPPVKNLQVLDLSFSNLNSYLTEKGKTIDTLTGMKRAFEGLPHIVTLNLSSNELSSKALKGIFEPFRNKKLQHLDLSENLINGPNIKEIGKIRSLKTLNLSHNPLAIPSLAEGLGQLSSLETLDLRHTEITDSGAVLLASQFNKLPHFQSLSMNGNLIRREGMGAIVSGLASLEHFHFLGLGKNRIGGWKSGKLNSLKTLNLSYNPLTTPLTTSFRGLGEFTSLETLNLRNTGIDNKRAALLASEVSKLPYLQSLNLQRNLIGPEGMEAIVSGLAPLEHLHFLNFAENPIGNLNSRIISGLSKLENLQTLHPGSIRPETMQILVEIFGPIVGLKYTLSFDNGILGTMPPLS